MITIFNQLGVDITIAHQFVLFVVLFVLLKLVLFDKLQFVISLREDKTVNLDGLADKKLGQAERLATQYEEKLEATNAQAMKHISEVKAREIKTQARTLAKHEEELEKSSGAEREKLMQGINEKHKEVLKSVDRLSNDLVKKILN